jgi:hypothetical protein
VKNIQVIDGADNATFSVFRATDEEFDYIFPAPGQDIELVEDFFARHTEKNATEILSNLWLRPVHKSKASGIDGTLYYGYADKRHHLPASKREIDRAASDINQAQRELYARLQAESGTGVESPLQVTNAELLREVPGGPELLAWFGERVPSFHDAEVLTLALDREGPCCTIRIYTFEMTPEVDANGYFVLKKHVVVCFRLMGVGKLELYDSNHQNVIYGLSIIRTAQGGYRLELEPCYGLFGSIEAQSMTIALEPWEAR